MRRAIMFSLSVLLALGMLTLGAVPAQAKATKTSFSGTETTVSILDPGDVRIADGILHIRGQIFETTFEGITLDGTTLTWTNRVVANAMFDLETGDHNAFGSFAVDLTLGDLRGTFEGRFTHKFTEAQSPLRLIGQGGGDFEGMIFKGTAIEGPTGVFVHEGIILDPHG